MTALVDWLTVPLDPNWLRVVDPQWAQPLDPMYAARAGGRWNPPGIPTLYLCDRVDTARAPKYVDSLLTGSSTSKTSPTRPWRWSP